MGMILMFSLVGAFVVRGNSVDVIICAIAGVAGVALRFAKYPVAPIVIGMALGSTFEGKLRQGLISARGSYLEFLSDPIALLIFSLTGPSRSRPLDFETQSSKRVNTTSG